MQEGYRKGKIESNIQIASNIYELKISLPYTCDSLGEPGQFYMLRGWGAMDPFLPRPISICDISHGIITFLYEVRGRGTHIISKLGPGDELEVLGPLGKGFNLDLEGSIALVSGGIGIAPMIYLAKRLDAIKDFYCGFRKEAYYIDKLKDHVNSIFISTEEGSIGHKGFITDLLKPEKYKGVIACGPIPMMKKVVEMCKHEGVPTYISMENRMACGIGACLGCTIQTSSGMKRVCKEGPVFSGEEVVFSD